MRERPARALRARAFGACIALAGLGAVALTTSIASAAGGGVDPEVQKHFQLGNDLFREARYADALIEYEEAYRLSSNYKILFNRGQCLVLLKREPEAIEAFEHYLAAGGAEIATDRRQQVEQDLSRLKTRLGALVITGAPEGAEIALDEHAVGKAPLPSMPVGAGVHQLTVRVEGVVAASEEVKVVAGETTTAAVTITPRTAEVADPQTDRQLRWSDRATEPPLGPLLLPTRPAGGLVAPSIMLTGQLGGAVLTGDARDAGTPLLGTLDIGASWRPSHLIEVGGFFGGAIGRASLSGQPAELPSNAGYAFDTLGLRARLHITRGSRFDGWFGVDVGAIREEWTFHNTAVGDVDFKASSPLVALAVGVDFPISRTLAVGVVGRFLDASITTGTCSPSISLSATATNAAFICGSQSPLPFDSSASSRTLFELGLRFVWSLPIGSSTEPAEPVTQATARRDTLLPSLHL